MSNSRRYYILNDQHEIYDGPYTKLKEVREVAEEYARVYHHEPWISVEMTEAGSRKPRKVACNAPGDVFEDDPLPP